MAVTQVRADRRRWPLQAAVVVAVLAFHGEAGAQSVVAPSSHWGAFMYPTLEPTQELGVSFVLFSEFGKNLAPDGLPDPNGEGAPDRYNFQTETVGFNFLSLSNTRALKRHDAYASNLLYRSTVIVGVADDRATRWFQNQVIHRAGNLPPVPRGDTLDLEDDGPRALLLGYSGEVNYRFLSLTRFRDGYRMTPTPLFVGAGFFASTIQNEAFTQLGARNLSILTPSQDFYLSFSTMARLGAVLPSLVFTDLAGYYLTAQGSLGLHLWETSFPLVFELGATGTSGVFLERDRRPGDQATPLPQSLRERFVTLRAGLGDFSFQTFNDLLGGKDKGPTYGASVSYVLDNGLDWL